MARIPRILISGDPTAYHIISRSALGGYRTRYFTDSGIIGSKAFVSSTYAHFQDLFQAKREKVPKPISGLSGIYSLKRLTE